MKRVNYGHRIVYQMNVSQIYYDQEQKHANKFKTIFNVCLKGLRLIFLNLYYILFCTIYKLSLSNSHVSFV